MSSRFVSAGTNDAPVERDEAWLAAQQELEANQRRKAEEAQQPPAKSLYEALQANNAAKQEAFEEAAKLKNQFRALNEDEIEFLDSVLESTRAEEERVKKETAEGLEAFRKQQEEADKKLRASQTEDDQTKAAETGADEEESWTASGPRKRKRVKEKEGIRGLKLRKASTSEGEQSIEREPLGGKDASAMAAPGIQTKAEKANPSKRTKMSLSSFMADKASPSKESETHGSKPKVSKSGLGLVDYGSDED